MLTERIRHRIEQRQLASVDIQAEVAAGQAVVRRHGKLKRKTLE